MDTHTGSICTVKDSTKLARAVIGQKVVVVKFDAPAAKHLQSDTFVKDAFDYTKHVPVKLQTPDARFKVPPVFAVERDCPAGIG